MIGVPKGRSCKLPPHSSSSKNAKIEKLGHCSSSRSQQPRSKIAQVSLVTPLLHSFPAPADAWCLIQSSQADLLHSSDIWSSPRSGVGEITWAMEPLAWLTVALADANRSCGPPKLGRRLLSGVRRCRRRSAGGPLGPNEAREGPWGRHGVPRGLYINRAPIRDSRATRRAPTGPVVPKQGSDGNPSEPNVTRQAPMGPDG